MAIMFLYGKKPKVTTENVEILMTLAEFFLIQNLKAACVAWLKLVEITDENCLKLLQLSSLFDFEIPKCMEFVEGHLDSLFENEQFTDIDADSVEHIFTDKKLSYICMDDKLKFLIRWLQVDPIKRLIRADEFVELLNFVDISEKLLEEIANNHVFSKMTVKKVAAETTTEKNDGNEVLVMKKDNYENSFWCFDLIRNKWFKLEAEISDSQTSYSYFHILGVQNSKSTVYSLQIRYNENNIVFFDLETNILQTFPLVQSDSGEPFQTIDKVAVYEDVCIITEHESVETVKQTLESDYELDLHRRLCLMRLVGLNRIETTNIHIGRAVNNRIETTPLFTIKKRVSKICMDDLSSVAFITNANKHIIIYDFSDCRMEIVEETTTYNDNLCSAENGFVIFDDKRCIYLQRRQGPSLETKYQKKIIDFRVSDKTCSGFQMYFCKDRWYRYFQRTHKENYQFEYIPHREIVAAEHADDVAWTPLPLPLEASKCHSDTLTLKQIFYIRLPKSKLRCYIECPHCDQLKKAKSKSRTVYHTRAIEDDFYYDDSSDDDYYGYYGGGFGYYDDSDYYYDSD